MPKKKRAEEQVGAEGEDSRLDEPMADVTSLDPAEFNRGIEQAAVYCETHGRPAVAEQIRKLKV